MAFSHSKLKKVHPFLSAFALAALIGLSLFSTCESYRIADAANDGLKGDDMVTAWDRRLRKVRQLLPDHGIIGYLADWDIPGAKYGSSDQEVEFLLTQYTVAPVILERGEDHELILGNFSDSGDSEKIDRVQKYFGISLVEPFSNEIFLFKGTGK